MTVIDHDSTSPTAAVGITADTMDLTGREYRLISLGGVAESSSKIDFWAGRLESAGRADSISVHSLGDDGSELADIIASSTVGVRYLVSGPESAVMAAVATARAAGVLPCELFVHITGSDDIDIFCPHCDTVTRAAAEPGSTIECSGCARVLLVRTHLSSRHATYLASVL